MVAACPFPSLQGSQVFVEQLSEQLVARGHEVHLLTYGQGRAVEDRGYVHHRIRRLRGDDSARSGPRLVKPVLDLMLASRLARILGRTRFDVVHCHNYEAAIVGLTARLRRAVPVVYHSHNLMGDELPTYFSRRASQRAASWMGAALDRTVPRASDQVIALCDYSAGVLRQCGVSEQRLSIIPPAVVDQGPARPVADARRALGLTQAGSWVGYCGNLDAYQNLETLLDAFVLLRSPCAPRLLIATHRLERCFLAAVRKRGLSERVRVLEVVAWPDARLAMEACDLLVLPRNHGSGWPIKLLNYLSLGRAVLAGGCGGKVLVPGKDGEVVRDGSPAALAAAMQRLVGADDIRERLGRAGRQRFLSDFTWDAVLPAVERVYARCAVSNPLPTRGTHVNVRGWNR